MTTPLAFDSGFLPYYGKGYNRYGCICNAGKCKELTKLFRSKGDQRGNMYALPSTKENTSKRNFAVCKERKAHLARLHLNASEADTFTIDRRDQSSKNEQAATRAATAEAKELRRHVAVHHFHPKVIRFSHNNKKYKWLDTIPADWVRNNLQGNGDINGYSSNDKCGPDKFYMVPSYPFVAAQDDYNRLVETASVCATVTQVTATRRSSLASSTSSSRHSTGSTSTSTTTTTRDSLGSQSGATVRELEDSIRFLNDRLQERTVNVQTTINLTSEENRRNRLVDPRYILQEEYAGLNRLSITSDRFHAENPHLAPLYFGFDNWKYTKAFIKAVFWLEHEEPTPDRLQARLTKFEQCIIALIHLETGYHQLAIATMFSLKTHGQVSRSINLWVPEWGKVGEHLSVLPFIDAEFLDATEPQSYIDLDLRKVGGIIDGKDFYTETVRKDHAISTAQQGNKLGKASFRILTWSTPTGLVFEHTKPIFARSTEKKLNDLWARHGRLDIPVGYLLSGDKGFQGTSGMYKNHNTVIHPAFLHGDAQFSVSKIGWNHRACQLRYTCETVYARVTNRKTVDGFIPRHRFHLFEDACDWAHGRANLYLPLQMPRGADEYFKITMRHKENKKRKRSAEA